MIDTDIDNMISYHHAHTDTSVDIEGLACFKSRVFHLCLDELTLVSQVKKQIEGHKKMAPDGKSRKKLIKPNQIKSTLLA